MLQRQRQNTHHPLTSTSPSKDPNPIQFGARFVAKIVRNQPLAGSNQSTRNQALQDSVQAHGSSQRHALLSSVLRVILFLLALHVAVSLIWTDPFNLNKYSLLSAHLSKLLYKMSEVSPNFPESSRQLSARNDTIVVDADITSPTSTNDTEASEINSVSTSYHSIDSVLGPLSKSDSMLVGSIRPAQHRRNLYGHSMPECARQNKLDKSFLIVFMGQSGSTAIATELRTHPDVQMHDLEPVDNGEYAFNTTQALKLARNLFETGIAARKMPGFKIRPFHILAAPHAWAQLAREFNTRIVWQYRRNSFKKAVSEYAYRKIKMQGGAPCVIDAGCSFEITDMFLLHSLLQSMIDVDYAITLATQLIAGGRDCVLEMRYEDYLYEREGNMADLREFLGLRSLSTVPERKKTKGDNMCEAITNWNEVCTYFFGCYFWRHLLEDSRNRCSCAFTNSPKKFCTPRSPV